jgi:hypothetical protein
LQKKLAHAIQTSDNSIKGEMGKGKGFKKLGNEKAKWKMFKSFTFYILPLTLLDRQKG